MEAINLPEKWKDWQIVRELGRGSYGCVYEIRRDIFGDTEKAALKVISIPQNDSEIREMANDGYDTESITAHYHNYLENIAREYTLMKEMRGFTNIVYCDDLEYLPHSDGIGWDIYIKMELLTPLSVHLQNLAAAGRKVDDDLAIQLGMDICSALKQCKNKNIIHRDIKPQNIFVSPNGIYKLGDFGVAKVVEQATPGTRTGTFNYMAPEVYKGDPYDSAADIYSLGLVMYWLLNERRLPFLPLPPHTISAPLSENSRLRRFSGDPLPAPVNGSDALKAIVLRACAFRPEDRYSCAEDMLYELELLDPTDGVFISKLEAERKRLEKEKKLREDTERQRQEELARKKKEAEEAERLLREKKAAEKKAAARKRRSIIAGILIAALLLGSAAAAFLLFSGNSGSRDLKIFIQPRDQMAAQGEELTIRVRAYGEELSYEWMLAEPGSKKFSAAGDTDEVFELTMTAELNGAMVYCVITDANGNSMQTNTITLSLGSILILTQPTDVVVPAGEMATVTVEAQGEGLTYEWYFRNAGDSDFSYTDSFTGNSYSVEMSAARDGRQIYCVITDANGNSVQTDTVTISMTGALRIVTQPVSVTVAEGQTATVTVEAVGEGLTYEWYYRNADPNPYDFEPTTAFTGNTYSVEMNAARNGRQIYCVITDANGNSLQTDTVTINMG